MGTNGCPQGTGSQARAIPRQAMPTAPGAPGQPPDLKPLGNQGNRAPVRLTPVTAQSDMRRRLTAPARTGHPRKIATGSRPVPRGRPPVPGRRPDLAMAVKAQVTATRTMPTSQWPGRGGAGRSGIASLRRRWPGVTGRSSGAGPGIASARTRSRASAGNGACTSGGRGRLWVGAVRAYGRRPRWRLMPAAQPARKSSPGPGCMTNGGGEGGRPQCHVEERDRAFRADAALSDAGCGVFDGE